MYLMMQYLQPMYGMVEHLQFKHVMMDELNEREPASKD